MNKSKMNFIALLIIIILGVVYTSLPVVVFGDASPTVTVSNVNDAEKKRLEQLVSDLHTNMDSMGFEQGSERFISGSYDSSNKLYTLVINVSYYQKQSQKAKQDIMNKTLQTIDKSGVSRVNKVKIYNYVADIDKSTSSLVRQLSNDVDADFAEAYSTFKPFSGVIGWILGLLCLGIFVALALAIVIDIAYITNPIVQLACYNEQKKKAKYVSIEAQKAVEFAANSEGGQYVNPMSFYFKHKTKQFIAIAICILYLVSGQIYNLIANIMDAFQGVVG